MMKFKFNVYQNIGERGEKAGKWKQNGEFILPQTSFNWGKLLYFHIYHKKRKKQWQGYKYLLRAKIDM